MLPAVRRTRDQQRVLLPPGEAASAEFARAFAASSSLSRSLAKERPRGTSPGAGAAPPAEESAPPRPPARPVPRRPPLAEGLAAQQQRLVAELRRDAADHGPPGAPGAAAAVAPGAAARRAERQEAFLDSRKVRHDEAHADLERRLDALASRCEGEARERTEALRRRTREAEAEADGLLHLLEGDAEALGGRDEDEVHGVMNELEHLLERQRAAVRRCSAELAELEARRKAEGEGELGRLARELHEAAHVVDGEVERLVEERSLQLNAVLVENQRSIKTLETKLLVQALERSKEHRLRWHKGLLLWKQQRHRHTVEVVRRRIESNEFRQPPALVEILERVLEQQQETSEARSGLVASLFNLSPASISAAAVQRCDEQNTMLFDRAQEAFDQLVTELKDCIENVGISAEEMLSSLCQELEIHDARQEWGEHETVHDLVTADVRPGLQACLDHIAALVSAVTDLRSRQEEQQQDAVKRVIELFRALARAQAELNQGMQRVRVEYQGELEDCMKEHEDACAGMERGLAGVREEMNEEAHHDALSELKEQAFAKLLEMEGAYRAHSEQLLGTHRRYPETVRAFFAEAAEAFCRPLGLATEAGEEAAAARAAGEALAPWPPGAEGAGGPVLERRAPAALRERLLAGPEGRGQEAEAPQEEGEAPRFGDCRAAAEVLSFRAGWLEERGWLVERLRGTRAAVFEHLAACHRGLDCVDVEAECEAVRRELYQRLSRHTNRKGEVQVEWFVPRSAVIAKHKDKFERHVLEAARKSQGLDERMAQLLAEVEAAEAGYQERLKELAAGLAEPETLPALSALHRQAAEEADRFQERCGRLRSQLQHLARRAPEALRKENATFVTACEATEEQYGRKEVLFYRGEIEELNAALDGKAAARVERLQELEGSLEGRQQAPLAAFQQEYEEAERQLCASKGYGREHGQPRRRARGAYRGLAANVAAVRQHLAQLLGRLAALCAAEEGTTPALQGPPGAPDPGGPWVFSTELLSVLYTFACGLDALGSQLRAFKDEHAGRYRLEALPVVRLLCEAERAVAPESEEPELRLRRDCLAPVLGPLLRGGAGAELQCGEAYEAEVQAIVKQVHDTYASRGGTPDFMQPFLAKMQQSAERARQEACRGLRDWGDELREGALLQLGDALFGELARRGLAELARGAAAAGAQTAERWREAQSRRAVHEQRLGPHLSSPNAEEQLLALVQAERERHGAALQTAREDRGRLAQVLREEAAGFVQRLAARFEIAVRIVDCLPLHGHFLSLPGDEHAEPPRLSIKRRMRRLQSGAADTAGDGLPARRWDGLPQHELRASLSGGAWPADPALAELEPEAVKTELTPTVDSFRSPVHRKLVERRDFYYNQYKAEFLKEVKLRNQELSAREEREQAGRRSWLLMVRQLRGDIAGLDAPPEEAAEEVAATPTATAPPAKAAPASKAGAKAKAKK